MYRSPQSEDGRQMAIGGKHHALAALPPENDPVSIEQQSEWVSQVWTNVEKTPCPTVVGTPNRPACNESLHRPLDPGHQKVK